MPTFCCFRAKLHACVGGYASGAWLPAGKSCATCATFGAPSQTHLSTLVWPKFAALVPKALPEDVAHAEAHVCAAMQLRLRD